MRICSPFSTKAVPALVLVHSQEQDIKMCTLPIEPNFLLANDSHCLNNPGTEAVLIPGPAKKGVPLRFGGNSNLWLYNGRNLPNRDFIKIQIK